MIEHRFYIIHPGGRQRIDAHCNEAALKVFREHWSATATWAIREGRAWQRRLIRETREELATEEIKA
jgi:hypothetical protein